MNKHIILSCIFFLIAVVLFIICISNSELLFGPSQTETPVPDGTAQPTAYIDNTEVPLITPMGDIGLNTQSPMPSLLPQVTDPPVYTDAYHRLYIN